MLAVALHQKLKMLAAFTDKSRTTAKMRCTLDAVDVHAAGIKPTTFRVKGMKAQDKCSLILVRNHSTWIHGNSYIE